MELKSSGSIHLNNILYVPGLKKKLLYISCLEDRGDRVSFVNSKVMVCSKGSSIDDAKVIRICEGKLYRILDQLTQALVHDEINPCEL